MEKEGADYVIRQSTRRPDCLQEERRHCEEIIITKLSDSLMKITMYNY